MEVFKVGGAVRDRLLGRPVQDIDWVVVGATVDQMTGLGYQAVGADFAVFLHPTTGDEYALARLDRSSSVRRGRFNFFTSPDVSLVDDLARRDITINAMAETADGEVIDPHGGKADLEAKILRHVSPAFAEDPVRVLRVARFAARYAPLGFTVAPETIALMAGLAEGGALSELPPERIWKEFSRALMEPCAHVFIEVLRECGALQALMPELNALFGVPQPAAHHPEIDTGVHVLMVLTQTCKMNAPLPVRWAALMHDLGKGLSPTETLPAHHGHESAGTPLIRAVNRRFKVPSNCAHLAVLVGEMHTHAHKASELRPGTVLKVLQRTDAFRRPAVLEHFLMACEADARGRLGFEEREYPQRALLLGAYAVAGTVQAQKFIDKGLCGPAIGIAMNHERSQLLSNYLRSKVSTNGG